MTTASMDNYLETLSAFRKQQDLVTFSIWKDSQKSKNKFQGNFLA